MRKNEAKRIGILYFSPTNTTKKVCQAIASGMGKEDLKFLNITFPVFRATLISNSETVLNDIDHLIIGAPVYTGKLPVQVIECLNFLNGSEKKCTAVVVYGNRDYGLALRNMVEILIRNSFNVVAAGAFIGQHSYSSVIPVAIGRPDRVDLEKAYQFGSDSLYATQCLFPETIPVQLDWFSMSKKYYPLKPSFIAENCTQCGICSEKCPIGIISPESGDYMNKKAKDLCIGCMACVHFCKQKAKVPKPDFIMDQMIKYILKKASRQRLEPLTIFA